MLLKDFKKDTAILRGVESTVASWDILNLKKRKTNISTLLGLSQTLR